MHKRIVNFIYISLFFILELSFVFFLILTTTKIIVQRSLHRSHYKKKIILYNFQNSYVNFMDTSLQSFLIAYAII